MDGVATAKLKGAIQSRMKNEQELMGNFRHMKS